MDCTLVSAGEMNRLNVTVSVTVFAVLCEGIVPMFKNAEELPAAMRFPAVMLATVGSLLDTDNTRS